MQKAFFGLVLPPPQFALTNKINNISLNFVELHFTTLTQTVSAGAQDCMGIYQNRIAPVSKSCSCLPKFHSPPLKYTSKIISIVVYGFIFCSYTVRFKILAILKDTAQTQTFLFKGFMDSYAVPLPTDFYGLHQLVTVQDMNF